MTNTPKLITVCFLVIFLGIFLVWFGDEFVNLKDQEIPQDIEASPTPILGEKEVKSTESAKENIIGEKAVVKKVVDGDTIQLETGQTVRFIGIDTPETVDPRRPVGCFGKEASNEVKNLLLGKEIILQKDVSDTDKYKRLLRYIYLPIDGGKLVFVNKYLILEGFAKSSTYPPDVKFAQEFLEAERQARENKKGLWGRC